MVKTRRLLLILVTVLLLFGTCYAARIVCSGKGIDKTMNVDDEVYHRAEYALRKFLVNEHAGREVRAAEGNCELICSESSGRMTQRVTIVGDLGILPISGSVSKEQDGFFPGTYVLRFGKKEVLDSKVCIRVNINVSQGETVYIFTGNKEMGYVEIDSVEAIADNTVVFETNAIQNYILSTTDIVGAEKAMADYYLPPNIRQR